MIDYAVLDTNPDNSVRSFPDKTGPAFKYSEDVKYVQCFFTTL